MSSDYEHQGHNIYSALLHEWRIWGGCRQLRTYSIAQLATLYGKERAKFCDFEACKLVTAAINIFKM